MSTSSAAPRRGDGTDAAEVRPPMREALVAAAFRLFLERGYEQTTVDDIVALAGVGRRSFFRYFPSKEDVVFPDHERCLADMQAFLARSPEDADPVRRVCDAARLVLGMYAENPAFSVQRYRLTKKGPRPARLRVVGGVALRAGPRRVPARAAGRTSGRQSARRRDRGRGGRGPQQRAAVLAAFGRARRRGRRGGPRTGVRAVRVRRRSGAAPRHLARGRGGRGRASRHTAVAGAAGDRDGVRARL
ncbi:LOW QUALITY PROTEIN: regulatory protein, partial [Streptomyces lividans TK24]